MFRNTFPGLILDQLVPKVAACHTISSYASLFNIEEVCSTAPTVRAHLFVSFIIVTTPRHTFEAGLPISPCAHGPIRYVVLQPPLDGSASCVKLEETHQRTVNHFVCFFLVRTVSLVIAALCVSHQPPAA